jgi:glycine amidinotransferase
VSPSESLSTDAQTPAAGCVVNTFNEWDPLEEIIVGVVEDALIPPWETISPAVVHDKTQWDFFKSEGGKRWPLDMLRKAEHDIEAFVHILEAEGVTVRRPERFA